MAAPKVVKDNNERWLLTYSDLMNLLLILFIILYCSSQINAKKAAAVAESISHGFNNSKGAQEETGGGLGDVTGTASDIAYWSTDDYGEFYKEVTQLIDEENLTDVVTAKLDNTGVIISFKDTALFAVGNADLDAEAGALIDEIGGMLYRLNYSYILVEGHTDSDPINTAEFPDNMALSSARAGNVWRELVQCGLAPESMAAIGYGEYRPIAKNDSAENKSKNRRVIITILKKPFVASENIAQDQAENALGAETSPAA